MSSLIWFESSERIFKQQIERQYFGLLDNEIMCHEKLFLFLNLQNSLIENNYNYINPSILI